MSSVQTLGVKGITKTVMPENLQEITTAAPENIQIAILGITALVTPIPVEARFLSVDVPLMVAISLGLAVLLWLRGGLGRVAGAVFLALYTLYIAAMAVI